MSHFDESSGEQCQVFQAKGELQVHIRWLIRRDMPEVLAIEDRSFEFPWPEHEFIRCLRQRNCMGKIAECNDRVVGYMIYEFHKTRLHLLNMAVELRRQGVGSVLVKDLTSRLSPQRRRRATVEVRETNLPALLFFKSQGFRAVNVLRDWYDDTEEDAVVMQYRLKSNERVL